MPNPRIVAGIAFVAGLLLGIVGTIAVRPGRDRWHFEHVGPNGMFLIRVDKQTGATDQYAPGFGWHEVKTKPVETRMPDGSIYKSPID